MLVIKAEIHKMLAIIAKGEGPDQTASPVSACVEQFTAFCIQQNQVFSKQGSLVALHFL